MQKLSLNLLDETIAILLKFVWNKRLRVLIFTGRFAFSVVYLNTTINVPL